MKSLTNLSFRLQPGLSTLQDLILILVSAIYFLVLVLDAFYHENGSQLLVSMASGGLNLVQLIVYAVRILEFLDIHYSSTIYSDFSGCL
jgi:hypothetical protein